MYRSIRHVEFLKFQTGIFVEWKAPMEVAGFYCIFVTQHNRQCVPWSPQLLLTLIQASLQVVTKRTIDSITTLVEDSVVPLNMFSQNFRVSSRCFPFPINTVLLNSLGYYEHHITVNLTKNNNLPWGFTETGHTIIICFPRRGHQTSRKRKQEVW